MRTVLAPFERVKLEYLLNQVATSLGGTVRTIFVTEGLAGFWKGNIVNLFRTAPYKAINFTSFDFYRGLAASW